MLDVRPPSGVNEITRVASILGFTELVNTALNVAVCVVPLELTPARMLAFNVVAFEPGRTTIVAWRY